MQSEISPRERIAARRNDSLSINHFLAKTEKGG